MWGSVIIVSVGVSWDDHCDSHSGHEVVSCSLTMIVSYNYSGHYGGH